MRKKTSILHQQVKEVQYLKDRCIICQEDLYEKLHKVEFEKTSQHMLEIAKALTDKAFFMRLNTIPNATDAIANNVLSFDMLGCFQKKSTTAKERQCSGADQFSSGGE
jgi:hypothetical protein